MRRHSTWLTMLVALATVSACNSGQAPTASTRVAASPEAASSPGVGVIQGVVTAPVGIVASVVPVGGGNVVPVGGGNVVPVGGGNVIPAGSGNLLGLGRRVLDLSEQPLANTQVFLADAAGEPYPALSPVTTDANGNFSFPSVPADVTFMVVAQAHDDTRQKDVTLQTLVRSSTLGANTSIDASTSLVTLAVTEGQSDLGGFNAAAFRTATQDVGKKLTAGDVPDLSDRSAILTEMDTLSQQLSDLKTALDEVRSELQQINDQLAVIQKELSSPRPTQAPSPNGTPYTGPGSMQNPQCAPRTHQFQLSHSYPRFPLTVEFQMPTGQTITQVTFDSQASTPQTGVPEGCPMNLALVGAGGQVVMRYGGWQVPAGSAELQPLPF